MIVKTAIRFDTERPLLRGTASVLEFWPNRVITIASFASDLQRLSDGWRRLGGDFRKAMESLPHVKP